MKVRLVAANGKAPPKTYVVATDDQDKAASLAVLRYPEKNGSFWTWLYEGPELAGMADGEIREILDDLDADGVPHLHAAF